MVAVGVAVVAAGTVCTVHSASGESADSGSVALSVGAAAAVVMAGEDKAVDRFVVGSAGVGFAVPSFAAAGGEEQSRPHPETAAFEERLTVVGVEPVRTGAAVRIRIAVETPPELELALALAPERVEVVVVGARSVCVCSPAPVHPS